MESADSTESAAATADGTAPSAPTAAAVTGGGPVIGTATCGVAAGTRYVNLAGRAAVPVTATIPAPEAGESVVFTAGAATSTVSATGTSVL